MKKYGLYFILFVCFQGLDYSISAQNYSKIDSLKRALNDKKNTDSLRILANRSLLSEYAYINPDSSKFYHKNILSFAEGNQSQYIDYYYHFDAAFLNFMTADLDSAEINLLECNNLAEKLYPKTLQIDALSKLSKVAIRKNKRSQALKYSLEALGLSLENKDFIGASFAYLDIGNVYYYEDNLSEALNYYLKNDSISEVHHIVNLANGNALNNIGLIYFKLKNLEKAKEYFLKAQNLYLETDYLNGQIKSKSRLAQIAIEENKYDKAIALLSQTLEYHKNNQDPFQEGQDSFNMALAFFRKNNKEKGFLYIDKSIKLMESISDSLGVVEALLIKIPELYKEQSYRLVKKECYKALAILEDSKDLRQKKSIIDYLSKSLNKQGLHKDAYHYKEIYIKLRDSLEVIEDTKTLEELETKYQTRQKEQEIALLRSQNELAEQQKKIQRTILLGGLTVASILGVVFFILYRNRQKTNKKLLELDEFKSKMFDNLSHEFRTPLTVIQGLSIKLENSLSHYTDLENIHIIRKNASLLDEQLKQMLAISTLEKTELEQHNIQSDIIAYLKHVTKLFSSYAHSQGQELKFESEINALQMDFDPEKMQSILQNLISNALKFNKEKGTVTVDIAAAQGSLVVKVKDQGKGIPQDKINKIFDRFYTSSKDSTIEGTGIGLAYVKELVILAQGEIEVDSTINEGSCFSIRMPITTKAKKTNTPLTPQLPFVYRDRNSSQPDTKSSSKVIVKKDKTILVVEDNKDIQLYYKQLLTPFYNVIKGFNGKEAYELLERKDVDIIISDLSMPEMDGFEFSRKLKNTMSFSHIPLIIVSANVNSEAKVKGYELGIDAFITKPFKENELLSIIDNLFEKQKQKTNYFAKLLSLKKPDEKEEIRMVEIGFVQKIQSIALEKSLYTTDQIASKMGISRTVLNQKVKTLTGMPIANYIKHIKVEKAKELLKGTPLQVSEIAFQLGYEDPSLFGKIFKKSTGTTPVSFRKNL